MIPNLVFVLRRRWPILVLLPILTVAAVVLATPSAGPTPTKYTTKVYLSSDPQRSTAVQLEQAAVEIKQPEVAAAAAAAIGEPDADPQKFAVPLKVKVDRDSFTLNLTAQDTDKVRVREYTEAFANAFIDWTAADLSDTYKKQLITLQDRVNKAQDALNEFVIENAALLQSVPVDVAASTQQQVLQTRLAEATTRLSQLSDNVTSPYRIAGSDPVTAIAPDKLQLPASKPVRAVLAFILGLLGALAITAFIEKLNPRIDDPKQAEAMAGAPVLAQVPIIKGKQHLDIERADLTKFTGPFAESFRAMRSHLDYRSVAEGLDHPPCVMVVSSAPGEGKTTTSAFLALSYAEAGRDVIVVGADFRRPAVHRLFGVDRTPGLSSRLLTEDAGTGLEMVKDIVKQDERTGVRVVPSGPGTDRVTGLLNDFNAVTEAGRQAGCSVVVDTAPVMVANDAVDFLPSVDWVIVVVRLGRSTQRSLRQTMQSLELNHATVVGCVVVGSLEASDSKRYYYSYYRPDEDRTLDPELQIRAARRQAETAHEMAIRKLEADAARHPEASPNVVPGINGAAAPETHVNGEGAAVPAPTENGNGAATVAAETASEPREA